MAIHGHQREHRALKTPHQRNARRSIGRKMPNVDHVEDTLDQVGCLPLLSSCQRHSSIVQDTLRLCSVPTLMSHRAARPDMLAVAWF